MRIDDSDQKGIPIPVKSSMLQAEIGGGARVDPEEGLQRPGYLLRDFALTSALGHRIQISDYRGRSNLVLVFTGHGATEFGFLQDAAARSKNFTEQEAIVIVVNQRSTQDLYSNKQWSNLPFPMLVDDDGRIHRLYGALDQQEKPSPVIYVTDRFGEIVSVHDIRDGKDLPTANEVRKTLEFLNSQCPECEPPEWPR
jgi:peroxiredoxin